MKILMASLMILVLCVITLLPTGCGSESGKAFVVEDQMVTVQRGDLTIDITAVGNLALSLKEDLSFEISGTIEEVLVEEGDAVEEGQILAKLDVSEWEDQLKALEDQLTAAERQLTAKQRELTVAERQLTAKQRELTAAERQMTAKQRELTAAERNVAAKILDLLQAQINLKTAESDLEEAKEPFTEEDISNAEADVDEAEYSLEFAQWKLDRAALLRDKMTYEFEVLQAEHNLDIAQQNLNEILAGFDTEVVAIKQLKVELSQAHLEDTEITIGNAQTTIEDAQIAIEDAKIAIGDAQIAIEDAKIAVEDAQIAIEDAKIAVEDAQIAIEDAKIAVEDAQEELDEARSVSVNITAPFDGFVTMVNVDGGDEILTGTVAVVIADPNEFEADILVSEMDILQVKSAGEAWVQLDAIQGMSLPAEVTHISPTATIQSGVVNYEVKVKLQPLEETMPGRYQARDKIVQGQTEQEGELLAMPEDSQLREGLTVTVSILVAARSDVLLVPNTAITSRDKEVYVQVVLPGGTTEERSVTPGISNWQYTEITSGLSENEQVLVPQWTTTPTASTDGKEVREGSPSRFRMFGRGAPPH